MHKPKARAWADATDANGASTLLRTVQPRRSRWPEGIAGIAMLMFGVSMLGAPLTHDVVWQLWIGRQLIGGTSLYSGIMELNPPLWFWMGMVVDRLSAWAHVAPGAMLVTVVTGAAAVAVITSGRLLPSMSDRRRAVFLVYAAALIMIMPRYDFGQREQLALIGALPWCLLAARRAEGLPTPPIAAICIGLTAAFGFALKHYFLVVPGSLELWLMLRLRRSYRPWRPEALALVAVGVAYAAAVLAITPQYLTTMIPRVRTSYAGYDGSLGQMIQNWPQAVWALAGIVLIATGWMRGANRSTTVASLLIAAAGFGFGYVAQHKGWPYQSIAVTGCLCLGVMAELLERGYALTPLSRFGVQLFLSLPLLLGLFGGTYYNWFEPSTRIALDGVARGETVMVMTADPMQTWPTIETLGLRWPSRYYSYWMMPAIAAAEHAGAVSAALASLDRTVVRETAVDLLCHPPARILIERRPYNYGMALTGFDYRKHFDRDPLFARLMKGYRAMPGNQLFERFDRVASAPLPPYGAGCRTIY